MFTEKQISLFENVLNILEKFESERLKVLFGDHERFESWLEKQGVNEQVSDQKL
jgi:hypothetical protein